MEGHILAIETSGARASMALWKGGSLVEQAEWVSDRRHSSSMFPHLTRLLQLLGGERLELILVGAGPGSYGGVRTALAAADGVSLIHHGCQVVSICSWLALPVDYCQFRVHVVSNARRSGWAIASFVNHRQDGELSIVSAQELAPLVQKWIQAGDVVCSTDEEELADDCPIPASSICIAPPSARLLGELWFQISPEERKKLASQVPQPIYVRPPHITQSNRPPWAIRSRSLNS